MRTLSRYEIIEQLKRLGVSSHAECDVFCSDYREYVNHYHDALKKPFKTRLKDKFDRLLRYFLMIKG